MVKGEDLCHVKKTGREINNCLYINISSCDWLKNDCLRERCYCLFCFMIDYVILLLDQGVSVEDDRGDNM